jgi:hypothetical protein
MPCEKKKKEVRSKKKGQQYKKTQKECQNIVKLPKGV